ncbi:Transmembrane protein 59-like [Harpegnathos saltator]|uniref:Transmembrane protein 59-like n=2 Tax=Harpegnathos saltator TaxID=610380 RepID=E2B8U7_HARSA|nr:Transmembrane protein 59-like [Harpegnathos saltator]
MRGNTRVITSLLVSLIVELTRGDMSYNIVNREDPCISLCEKTSATFANSIYVKSCCQRGCRFFNLVDLRYGLEPNSLNGTRDACEASCTEAYTEVQDRYACDTGCDSMAKQRISDLLALFSIAICMKDGIDSNVLLSPDIPENDILTDPGLRKELLPRWWDSDGFKLPQTYVKTVPMDVATVDYALSSDYSGEVEQAMPVPASDWFHCASKHIGTSYRYMAFVVLSFIVVMMLVIWLYTLINFMYRRDMLISNSILPMVTLHVPLHTLYKKEMSPHISSDDCESN